MTSSGSGDAAPAEGSSPGKPTLGGRDEQGDYERGESPVSPPFNGRPHTFYRDRLSNLPGELRALRIWACSTEADKAPRFPNGVLANHSDPGTWSTFEECRAAIGTTVKTEHGSQTITHCGYMHPDDGFHTTIDLDRDGEVEQRIRAAFKSTYTERSRSGRGFHIIARGRKQPGSGSRRDKVEVYDHSRYIICTGDVIGEVREITDQQEMVDALCAQLWREEDLNAAVSAPEKEPDEQILKRLAAASNAEDIRRLWEAHWEEAPPKPNGEPRYPSQSEADFGLTSHLCFYTKNYEQIVRIFRQSDLGQRHKAWRKNYLLDGVKNIISRSTPPTIDFTKFKEKLFPQDKKVEAVEVGAYSEDDAPPLEIIGWTAEEILTEAVTNSPYLVKGWVYRGSITTFFGESKAMKSFSTLDMVCHAACGLLWAVSRVQATNVAIILGEGIGGYKRRVQAWFDQKRKEGIDPAILAAGAARLYVHPKPVQMVGDNGGGLSLALRAAQYKLKGTVDLVLIDTFVANLGDGKENDNSDIAKAFGTVQRVCPDRGVVLVHHVGHSEKDRERGGYNLMATPEVRVQVKRQTNDNGETRILVEQLKAKDGEELPQIAFSPQKVLLGTDDDGDPITSLVLLHQPTEPFIPAVSEAQKKENKTATAVATMHGALCARGFLKQSPIDLAEDVGRNLILSIVSRPGQSDGAARVALSRVIKKAQDDRVWFKVNDRFTLWNG